jgi:hypothetical protein
VATVGDALKVAVEVAVWPAVNVTVAGLKVIVSGGDVGVVIEVAGTIEPAKPFRLVSVAVAVPVDPEANEMIVGLIVKPKSLTATLSLTVLTRVSGLASPSTVAYVPDTMTK